MARAVVAILGIVLVGAVAVWGLQAAAASAGEQRTITGESWTPEAGSVTQLDHSGLPNAYYADSVTVEDSNGNLMDAGVDYEWFEDNGTIKALSGGGLDGETSATIDYEYRQTTENQRALIGIVAMLPRILGIVAPLLGVALLLLFLRG